MEISERQLTNWVEHVGINAEIDHDPVQIHAGGHVAAPEIQAMIDKIQPHTLLPIHTEHPDRFQNPAGEIVTPVTGERILR